MFLPSSTLPPIQYDVSPAEYHKPQSAKRGEAGYVMSRSELMQFRKNPFKWMLLEPKDGTDAMAWGALVDMLVLTPDRADEVYAITPETYPCDPTKSDPRTEKPWNWNADYCKRWREEQEAAGKLAVKPDMWREAVRAKDMLFSDAATEEFIVTAHTQVQVNVEWLDHGTGIRVPVKCLIDLVPKGGDDLADLKTTNDAEHRAWAWTVKNFGLDYQAALYLAAYNAATGEKRRKWTNVISESEPPYVATWRPMGDDFLSAGKTDFEADLALYCQCLADGKWPTYDKAEVNFESLRRQ